MSPETTTPELPSPAGGPDFHARWEAALRELELDVAVAEAMLAGDHVPEPAPRWTPPQGLGPLPVSLRRRAQLLVDRQIEVAQQLAETLARSRQQVRLLQTLKAGTVRQPVYVDADG